MINSYRIQAERRASFSRPHVPGARAAGKSPLELPPWGYGGGRHVLSMPVTMINSTQRLFRPRMRSASPAKQTNSSCETSSAQSTAACSGPGLENAGPAIWSTSTTSGREGEELGAVVELKSAESSAEKNPPNEIGGNTATVVATAMPTQDLYRPGAVHSIGDTVVTGGGPVTSSSMETWTTYDGTSSSPRLQSAVSSPHNLTPLNGNSNAPSSPTHSATLWSHRLSPTSPTSVTTKATPLDVMLTADLANRMTTNSVITLTSPPSDVIGSPKSTPATVQPTANEPVTLVDREVPPTATALNDTDKSHEQKTVAPSANDSSACEVTVDTPVSMNSSNDGKGAALRPVSSRTDPSKSPTATSKANDQDKSSLMVGLVKVKSRHTGLMIDCPILETLYQNEVVESSSTAVRQSSSHKVVLIKAVVPRWAWNGRGQFSQDSSTRASPSSVKSNDRCSVDSAVKKRKSSVSVNTQTSDTLLSLRRTISEHQTTSPSAIPVVDTHMYVPALHDECQLIPSPKLSACFVKCKSTPSTPTECNVGSPKAESRVPSLPKSTNYLSSARSQSKKLMSPEAHNLPTSPLLHGYMPLMSEKPKESESMERPSMEYDSLMEDTIENLKLDLQFSSSGNNSDSESVTLEKVVVKRSSAECCNRSSSLSSDDMRSSGHGRPTLNWSCAATAATASSDAVADFQTSGYVDEMAIRAEPSLSSPHQKRTSAGRGSRTPPSQRHSPASNLDNNCRPRADDSSRRPNNTKYQSSPKSSQRNDTRARQTPDSCSRPNRSPCPWRSLTSNDAEQESWLGRDLSCQDPHQYERQQRFQSPASQQHTLSTTQYASRSESSLSDASKSTNHDCYEMTTRTAPATVSPRSPQTELSSALPPDQMLTSGGSDTCATEPLDANMHHHHHHRQHHHHHHHHHHRATNDFRLNAAGGVKSTTYQSRHNHRRSTPGKKDRAGEPKSTTQERCKVSITSGTKTSSDRQRRWSTEATRRGEVAQNSQSTGSMTVPRHARLPTATTKRQHSSSTSRHMPRNSSANKRTTARDVATDRQASLSRERYCTMGDIQRRSHTHSVKHSAFDQASRRRSDKQTTSSGRRQRHGNWSINASMSKSVDSVSRDRGRPQSVHANYTAFVAEQSNSRQPKCVDSRQSRRHDDHQSNAMFYECRRPIVYCSPRSLKPFPPPISDRYPLSSFVNSDSAAVGTSLDAETVQYVLVQRQEDNDCGDDQPGARDDYPPLAVPPSLLQERLYRCAQTGVDQRRGNAAAVSGGGRRRKKLPATPVDDGHGTESEVSVRIAVPSVIERPAWRQY